MRDGQVGKSSWPSYKFVSGWSPESQEPLAGAETAALALQRSPHCVCPLRFTSEDSKSVQAVVVFSVAVAGQNSTAAGDS